MSEDSPLIGEELYYKFEDLLEEEDDRQERMYACGYDFYPNFFKVLSEAYKTELEDIIFESLTEYEIPFTVFEIAKFIKLNYFYDFIIKSLIQRGIKYDLAFKIIKSYGLKIYFKNEYGTGYITDPINIYPHNKYITGEELIKKATDKNGEVKFDRDTMIECGYILLDNNINEEPDVIKFFEEVFKEKKILLNQIELDNFNLRSFKQEIEDEMNDECKYIAADWVCFENTPDLEIYKLCEDINVEIDLINETESQEKISPYKQEIVPFGFGEKEISGYLPPGKYWIGDLSYVMEDYFDKYLYMVEGVYQTQKNINFARFNTNGDGYYFDYEANSYGVDAGNIGCVEVEGIYEDNDLGKFHIFDFPFKCSKNEVEGYLRFGDVFIKTEKYSDFFLPPHLNTYKGKASLQFGKKFLDNDIHISEVANESSDYWLDRAKSMSYGDIVDKTVAEIYRVKSKILLNKNDPNKAFICLINNHGLCQTSEAFLRIFNDIFYLDDDEDDQSNSLFDFVDNSKLDIVQLKDNKITNISSLNLEEDPEIQEDIKSTKIENLLEKVRSILRKQLWPEGEIAADWWRIHSITKEKEGDKDYALMASLMAKFHLKELSGDKVFTEGSKLSKEDQYRIYFDMVQNCEWFFKLNPD